jgi:hypothetical protein
LAKLERGLITIEKRFKWKTPQTWLQITPADHTAFQFCWDRLEARTG